MRKSYFSISELVFIAMIAAMGIGVKTIIAPLIQIITGPLFIPGGVVAGGIYMSFLVLATSITNKIGSASLVAILQAVFVMITGTIGTHGVVSLLTYSLPGIFVDLFFLISRNKGNNMLCCFIAGMIANVIGSYSVNLIIFNLSIIPLLLSLVSATLSGGIGGLVAYSIGQKLNNIGLINNNDAKISTYIPIPKELENKDMY